MARRATSLGPKPSLFVFLFFSLFCCYFIFIWRVCLVFVFFLSFLSKERPVFPYTRAFLFFFECLPLLPLSLSWHPPFSMSLSLSLSCSFFSSFLLVFLFCFLLVPCFCLFLSLLCFFSLSALLLFDEKNNIKIFINYKVYVSSIRYFFWFRVLFSLLNFFFSHLRFFSWF